MTKNYENTQKFRFTYFTCLEMHDLPRWRCMYVCICNLKETTILLAVYSGEQNDTRRGFFPPNFDTNASNDSKFHENSSDTIAS